MREQRGWGEVTTWQSGWRRWRSLALIYSPSPSLFFISYEFQRDFSTHSLALARTRRYPSPLRRSRDEREECREEIAAIVVDNGGTSNKDCHCTRREKRNAQQRCEWMDGWEREKRGETFDVQTVNCRGEAIRCCDGGGRDR